MKNISSIMTVLSLCCISHTSLAQSQVFKKICSGSSNTIVIVVDSTLEKALGSDIHGYTDDICSFEGYSSYVLSRSTRDNAYVDEVLKLSNSDSTINGSFLIGSFAGEKFSLLAASTTGASLKQKSEYYLVKAILGSIFIDNLTTFSNERLERIQVNFDQSHRLYISAEPEQIDLDRSLFTSKLPLGGLENLAFYHYYFKKISDFRRKNFSFMPYANVFSDSDHVHLLMQSRIAQELDELGILSSKQTLNSQIDLSGQFSGVMQNALAMDGSTSFIMFHGEDGRTIAGRWNPFQSVINLKALRSNNRMVFNLACDIAESDSSPGGFVFRSLTSGNTINVVAGREITLEDEILLSKKFMTDFFGREQLVGPTYRFLLDNKLASSTSGVMWPWDKEVYHLYGDPLLPLKM